MAWRGRGEAAGGAIGAVRLLQQVQRYVERRRLVPAGSVVVCAVSGGADSVAMLHILDTLKERLGITLEVGHVHHGIPEALSDDAAALTRGLARELGLRLRLVRADVPGLSRRWGISLEAAGRRVRYAWFRRLLRISEKHRVATAHTADDQAETVLMRILRGCGLDGLGGIRPDLHWRIVRPLLGSRRALVRDYVERLGLPIVEDPTNRDVSFTRNRVRHELLPMLEERFNPSVVEALGRLADAARDDADCLMGLALGSAGEHVEPTPDGARVDAAMSLVPHPLAWRVWRYALQHDIDSALLERLDDLLRGSPGRQVPLPSGGVAIRTYEGVEIRGSNPPRRPPPLEVAVRVPGQTEDEEREIRVTTRIAEVREEAATAGTALGWSALLDFDAVQRAGPLRLRARRRGDRWVPPGHASSEKLKDAFNRWRVPPHYRDQVPILAAGGEVVAIVPHGTDARFAARPGTTRILRVEVTPTGSGE